MANTIKEKRHCNNCNGTGWDDDNRRCLNCDGTGIVEVVVDLDKEREWREKVEKDTKRNSRFTIIMGLSLIVFGLILYACGFHFYGYLIGSLGICSLFASFG